METMKQNTKSARIKEIIDDVNAKSVRAFAISVGLSQSAVASVVTGYREPSYAMMSAIVKKYPQFSLRWLATGEGDKYKDENEIEDFKDENEIERDLSDRCKRLKEVYEESGRRSVRSFAMEMGQKQTTFGAYFVGTREPSDDMIRTIIKHYPIYNFDWLAYGKGDKFNPENAEMGNDSNLVPPQPIPLKEPAPIKDDSAEKLNALYEKLDALYEKLVYYMERCSKLEKELREMQEKKQS